MRSRWAERIEDIQPFHVMAVLARARELEAVGEDVIHMEIGEPDFATPIPIIQAGQRALADGCTGYTPALGLFELREAIAGLYRQRHGLDIDPRRVIVTPGGSAALLLVSALLVNPGQQVVMADPSYPCNRNFLRLVEGRALMLPTSAENGWQLTPEQLQRHWNADCRAVLAASPANPTGTLMGREQLAGLASTVSRLGGELIVDEIYHGLTYGCDAVSALEVNDDIFVLNSFSKYFGMTGWRLGWLIAPEAAVAELEKLAQNLYICAPHMAQRAALAAFTEQTREICEARREAFRQRRDFLLPALRELGMHIPHVPEGAFYLYADSSGVADDSAALCRHLIETRHLAITPGLDFGEHRTRQHLRFAYTTGIDRLEQAVERLRLGLQQYAC
ncbi:MAG: pyridoxal phosphate-dependent aminotransferase [Halopseudomonas yangmingensis]|uniref:Aminotransferase n=1 Tax=Halopseudomonas yangmingensis TaxID=1720063 RepID=A0A1I4TQP9_9GAMM|nr:pyridoxal phosphate-dependent aminotransferase [Halopseudomonas yangmingensis]SFM78867.1 Aspartate/methionine/tyrosine aminotransferase [Halopseudomonas yangmingensis]